MKKTPLAVAGAIAATSLAILASCGGQENKAETTTVETAEIEAPAPSCKIAYFEADSVISNYILAQQLNEESQRMMLRLQQQADAKQRELQQKAANIENKRQRNIYLSEASFQHDMEEFQQAQADAERQINAQQAQLQQAMARSQQRLTDSLHSAVARINAVMGYDAILLSESGVYFNPEMNITAQIIEDLNAHYNAQ